MRQRCGVKRCPPPSETDRLAHAYRSALPEPEKQLGRRATMYATAARTAAARGLIVARVEGVADIDRITADSEHGVRHDGQQVPLVWAQDAALEQRRTRLEITTTLHIAPEAGDEGPGGKGRRGPECGAHARVDRTGGATRVRAGRAQFTEGHGLELRRIIDALGTGGLRSARTVTTPHWKSCPE
jgi:hypothetical protein